MNDKYQNFFTDISNTTPYFKMAAEGLAGTGKTYTLALVAVGLHKFIKSEKPIVVFDTETASKFLRRLFDEHGIKALVKPSRSLTDLMDTMDFCDQGGSDILFVDSITHIYEGFLETYKSKKGRSYIQFQDWAFLKPSWKREWSDRLVMGRYHILFTGREGYTYDYELNEDTGKKELVKTGVRMKAEGETAYEPDVLIRTEQFQKIMGNGDEKEVWQEATVIKDRSQLIHGCTFKNPTFENFKPVIEFLLTDVKTPSDLKSSDDFDLITNEEDNREDREQRKIMLERNNALLDQVAAGTSKDAKAMKLALMSQAYVGETSELAISRMSIDQLTKANDDLTEMVKLIKGVLRGEPHVYPVEKAVVAARNKYLESQNLGEVEAEKLQKYLDHIVEKYNELKKKEKVDASSK